MPRGTNADVGSNGTLSVPEAFESVWRSVQEALQRQKQEVVQEVSQLLEVKMEERLTLLAQRMEERVETLAEQMRDEVATLTESLARMERRVIALETTPHSASPERNDGQEAIVKKLEGRMQQLEASVQKTLKGVIPRVDCLLQQLEGNCPPAPFAVPSNSSASRQSCALPSVSSASRTSSASPSPLAPSPAVRSPSTASAPSPPFNSAKGFALGEELCFAAEEGRLADVRRLLNQGANIEHVNEYNMTPLLVAASSTQADVVSLLLEKGANVNAKSGQGATPLHWASVNDGSGRCVKLLLDGGALLRCKDRRGQTALHWAADNDNEEGIQLLLAAGASNFVEDADGKFPSELTSYRDICEILSFSTYQSPY